MINSKKGAKRNKKKAQMGNGTRRKSNGKEKQEKTKSKLK
jgi:hypothetical protein